MADGGMLNMSTNQLRYWLYAATPIHVGAGRGVDVIDLPIVRERTTSWPIIPGSSVKGVISNHFFPEKESRETDSLGKAAFGKAGDTASNAGALAFTDARIVCLPVRSFFGTFAWVTCPFCLNRLHLAENFEELLPEHAVVTSSDSALIAPEDAISFPETGGDPFSVGRRIDQTSKGEEQTPRKNVFLDEIGLSAVRTVEQAKKAGEIAEIIAKNVFAGDDYWSTQFKKRFIIIDNESFTFLCEFGTEVTPRIRITDKGIVDKGALWYEESLPAESILCGTVWCDTPTVEGVTQKQLIDKFCSKPLKDLQFGGKSSIGKGLTQVTFSSKDK